MSDNVAKPAAKTVKPAAKPAAKPAPKKSWLTDFLSPGKVALDTVTDEAAEYARYHSMVNAVTRKAVIIMIMCGALIVCIPIFKPIYRYAALVPGNPTPQPMIGLMMPNLTDKAVSSWAAASITEVLTIGFGDFETRLVAQKKRFTHDGWDAFVKNFLDQKIDKSFREHQLVLTSVPSDVPIITWQGLNAEHVYEWHIQIPVIMTYATNNNVTRPEKAMVELTVMRVPYEESSHGIAIDSWKQKKQ